MQDILGKKPPTAKPEEKSSEQLTKPDKFVLGRAQVKASGMAGSFVNEAIVVQKASVMKEMPAVAISLFSDDEDVDFLNKKKSPFDDSDSKGLFGSPVEPSQSSMKQSIPRGAWGAKKTEEEKPKVSKWGQPVQPVKVEQ